MDIGGMAERFSAVVSAPSAADPAPASDPTPAASPTAAPEAAAATPADTPPPTDIPFEDDPEELTFDETPQAAPAEAQQPADDNAETVANLVKTLNAGVLDKRLENALLHTNRGRRILSSFKTMRDLEAPPDFDPVTGDNKGGLGFSPNSQQIREFHKAHSDMQAMQHEFSMNPANFVLNWFGPDRDGSFRENVQDTLTAIPEMLDRSYQQAVETGNEPMQKQVVALYSAMFKPMLNSYIDGLYSRVKDLPEGQDRISLINAIRTIEYQAFGKYRDDAQLAPPKPEDKLKLREEELNRRESELKGWTQRNQSQAAQQARESVFNDIDRAITADIEKTFAASNLKGTMKPFAYQAALASYKQQIIAAVKQDAYAWRQYNFAMSKVGSTRGADAHAEAVKVYRQAAQQAIRQTYRTILKDLVDDQVTQNQAAHASAATSAARTAPAANGGRPSPQSVVPQPAPVTRLQGESTADYAQRRLAAAINGPAS